MIRIKPSTVDESAGDTDKTSTVDEHIVMPSGNVGEPGNDTDGKPDNGTVVKDTEIKEAYITLVMLSGSRDHIDIVDTNSARQRIIKGDYLCSQAKYDEAIKAYDEAIWIDPYNVDAWNGKGNALYQQGKYKASIKAYDMVIKHTIKSDPKLALAWYNKSIALKALGRIGEADAALAKAKELGYTGLSRST